MNIKFRLTHWLETRWVNPAYIGWVLGGLALFFFVAATNTLSGWLYVISGVIWALMAIAITLSTQNLKGIAVSRRPIYPVSAGDPLTIELLIQNLTPQTKTLLQVSDLLPYEWGEPATKVIESLGAEVTHYWVYQHPTQQRGVYRWQTVQLRSAAPLGLFWRRQNQQVEARAIVYPTVLPLAHCPLIDKIGRSQMQFTSDQRAQAAHEGVTRSLRPYRWGDPTRLIHWRTSARYGELRVRELESFRGGQELVVCLDSAASWEPESFEQAVIAIASLYFYALRQTLEIRFWTARTGVLQGEQPVLEALAATYAGEETSLANPPNLPLIWLTQNPESLTLLPESSRWVLWQSPRSTHPRPSTSPGLVICPERSLQSQLQDPLYQDSPDDRSSTRSL